MGGRSGTRVGLTPPSAAPLRAGEQGDQALLAKCGSGCKGRRTGFPAELGDSQHVRIPPAAHTYQSDVETVHRLVEDEFFDIETFTSRGDFLAKAHTYQLYFNLVRPNSHKDKLSPWQIIERIAPRSPLELCLLPPGFLDYYLNDEGGYDLPSVALPKKVTHEFAFSGCDTSSGTAGHFGCRVGCKS